MAQLWGGRFTKETDKKVFAFNASLSFDKNLLDQDVEGSVVVLDCFGAIPVC